MRHYTSSSHSEHRKTLWDHDYWYCLSFCPADVGNGWSKTSTAESEDLNTKVEVSIEPMEPVTNALAGVSEQ